MEHEAILRLIPDYALGLLAGEQQRRVERHIVTCPQCTVALQQEQQLAQLVRSTLEAATQPAPARLFQQMPRPPKSKAILSPARWQQQLAPVMVVLLLVAASLFTQLAVVERDALAAFGFGEPAATVASSGTGTPTVTLASLPNIPVALEFQQNVTAEATPLAETRLPAAQVTPAPLPTPGAALYRATIP